MGNLTNRIFIAIGKASSYLMPYKLSRSFKHISNLLYSGWISRSLNYMGNNTLIKRPSTIVGGKYITIGSRTTIGSKSVITAWDKYKGMSYNPQIIIGDRCSIGEYSHISAIDSIKIGNDVLTGRWVSILDNSHGDTSYDTLIQSPLDREIYSKGGVIIEDRVWIGDKVTILAGVTIGQSSIIASNSVVTKDIPPFTIVGGIPAKILKTITYHELR